MRLLRETSKQHITISIVQLVCYILSFSLSVLVFRKSSGVSAMWITERFDFLHPQAGAEEIERFARVWLCHFLGSFLFPDSSGNTISWIFLDILRQPWENIAAYSWGSAVLAWTYRQLCDACRRTSNYANLGGCSYLLQVWCWERWPVGRPVLNDLPVNPSFLIVFIGLEQDKCISY